MIFMILRVLFVFSFLLCFNNADDTKIIRKNKLIIDNDAGSDDAVAIFLALLHEKHFNGSQIVGLTTVHGNTKESNVAINNQRILKVTNRQDIPIYRGAKDSLLKDFERGNYYGLDGLGDSGEELSNLAPVQEKNAVAALIDLTKAHPGEITVITLGPLTNIALSIRLDPDFIGRLAHLYIGAGHIHGEVWRALLGEASEGLLRSPKFKVRLAPPRSLKYTLTREREGRHDTNIVFEIRNNANPSPEFNARMDVEAYHIVLENANPDIITVLPFSQVKKDLNYSKSWRQETLGAIDNDVVKAMNKYEQISIKKHERWQDLDPAVVAIAIKPDLVNEYSYSSNKIILNGEKRGINTNDFIEKEKANVRIALKLNKEEYRQFLLNVFSAEK